MSSIEDAATVRLLARELSRKPLPLATNKIAYVIAGGSLLPRFLGEKAEIDAPNPPSQMWVASTVTSALGEKTEGLSRVAGEDGGYYLKTLLDSAPELFLGAAHARKWGANPGYLIKLLNSRDRLLVQVHPDKEKARKYFDSDFGKTEAWFVVDAEKSAFAYAGFKPGVTKELLRAAILARIRRKSLGSSRLSHHSRRHHVHSRGPSLTRWERQPRREIQEPPNNAQAERKTNGRGLPESYLQPGEDGCAARMLRLPMPRFRVGQGRDLPASRNDIQRHTCVEQSIISRATTIATR